MQALSRATGSKDARMPTLGTTGMSFSPWQSQNGDTSHMMLMWKLGLSFTAAMAYSTILQLSTSGASS